MTYYAKRATSAATCSTKKDGSHDSSNYNVNINSFDHNNDTTTNSSIYNANTNSNANSTNNTLNNVTDQQQQKKSVLSFGAIFIPGKQEEIVKLST